MENRGLLEELTPLQPAEASDCRGAKSDSLDVQTSSLSDSDRQENALRTHIEQAVETSTFVFSRWSLSSRSASILEEYLRTSCQAKFVDLSYLEHWSLIGLGVAGSVQNALRRVRSLTLDGNPVAADAESVEAWCQAIEEHPGLQCLSLRDTGLCDESVCRLAQTFSESLTLFTVDLSCNPISDVGVEALTGAMTRNHVMLEILVEDTRASERARGVLEDALKRNHASSRGYIDCARMLQSLKGARAQAVAAAAQGLGERPAAAKTQPPSCCGSACADNFADMISPKAPSLAQPGGRTSDGIFFQVGEAFADELARRCEATAHYSVSDLETLRHASSVVTKLLAQRRVAYRHFEETSVRIGGVQEVWTQRLSPMEDSLMSLREQVDAESEAIEALQRRRIEHNMELKRAHDGMEAVLHDRAIEESNLEHLLSGLRWRFREVEEEVAQMQTSLRTTEELVEKLEGDNERCRKFLAAARFETETERFSAAMICSSSNGDDQCCGQMLQGDQGCGKMPQCCVIKD